jgi:hypothetical protein
LAAGLSFTQQLGGITMFQPDRRSNLAPHRAAALALAAVLGIACGDPHPADDVGAVQLAIAVVPDGVRCIQVLAAGPQRSQLRSFDVAATNSSIFLKVGGLPLGAVTFTGSAFSQACAVVTNTVTASWLSDAVLASVAAGTVGTVTLSMHRNGAENVVVDFTGEASCTPEGNACLTAAECCNGSCSAGRCQPAPTCKADGLGCDVAAECCTARCSSQHLCGPEPVATCQSLGLSCKGNSACCSGLSCLAGACVPTPPLCLPTGFSCTSKDECCPGHGCVGGVCAPVCAPPLSPCFSDDNCCSGLVCRVGACVPNLPAPVCKPDGNACAAAAECCTGSCSAQGRCGTTPTCQATGNGCANNSQCCRGLSCFAGVCVATPPICLPPLFSCTSKDECCPLNGCVNGTCSPACLPPSTPCFSDDNCCSGLVCRIVCVPKL